MAFTLTLSEVRTEVAHLAAIDGQTGSSGRHSPTRMNALINRAYRKLLSRVGKLGIEHGRQPHTGTLGSAVSGEEFINLDIPSTAAEVLGVDVKGGYLGSLWHGLDPISWDQRRDIDPGVADRVFPRGGLHPRHRAGFWALRSGPSVATTVLTQGSLAIWPTQLAGLAYTMYSVKQWPGITSDTDVFLLHDGWDEWLINSVVMKVAQRDENKRGTWELARDAWAVADALLDAEGRRLTRGGQTEPTPYGGIAL